MVRARRTRTAGCVCSGRRMSRDVWSLPTATRNVRPEVMHQRRVLPVTCFHTFWRSQILRVESREVSGHLVPLRVRAGLPVCPSVLRGAATPWLTERRQPETSRSETHHEHPAREARRTRENAARCGVRLSTFAYHSNILWLLRD